MAALDGHHQDQNFLLQNIEEICKFSRITTDFRLAMDCGRVHPDATTKRNSRELKCSPSFTKKAGARRSGDD